MTKKRRSSQFKDSSQVIDIEEARQKRQEKRGRLQKQARASHQALQKRPVRPSIKQTKRRRTIIYAAIIVSIIAVVGISIYNIVSLKQEQKSVISQQDELKFHKTELEQELKNLDNPDYIEEQARAQLRLVLPGEKIYVFPSVDDSRDTDKKETSNEN